MTWIYTWTCDKCGKVNSSGTNKCQVCQTWRGTKK